MKFSKNYKKTEIGIIPNNWQVEKLENLCEPNGLVRGPFGSTLKKEYFVNSGYKVYEQKNAIKKDTKIGNYYIDERKYQELSRFHVVPGDFIISCSGTIGKIFKLPENIEQGVINQALLKISIDNKKISDEFFYHYFDWSRFQERITENTQGGAMQNLIGMDEFRQIGIPVPPINEQHAIAEALSDVDALIEAQEALIEKKRLIKQGVMQELLTGKRRLSGFSGNWKVEKIGEIADFNSGKPNEKFVSENGKYSLITLDSISINGKLKSKHKKVDIFDNSLQKDDIVIIMSDIAHGNLLGLSDLIPEDNKYVLNQRVGRLRCNNKVNPRFIQLQINSSQKHFGDRGQGTSQKHIYERDIVDLSIKIPEIKEQNAISEIFHDFDLEISLLEKELNKFNFIKQGMMQELLTGRTRLM